MRDSNPKYVCRGCGKDWTSLPGSTIRCIVCGDVVDTVRRCGMSWMVDLLEYAREAMRKEHPEWSGEEVKTALIQALKGKNRANPT